MAASAGMRGGSAGHWVPESDEYSLDPPRTPVGRMGGAVPARAAADAPAVLTKTLYKRLRVCILVVDGDFSLMRACSVVGVSCGLYGARVPVVRAECGRASSAAGG